MTTTFTPTPTNETSAVEFDDGDAPSAGNINPLAEAGFNTAKWAANRVGAYRLTEIEDTISSSGGTTLGTTTDATYGTNPVEIGDVAVVSGDAVEVSVDVHVAIGLAASTGEIKLYYVIGLDAPVDIPGAVNILATSFSTEKLVHVGGIAHPTSTGTMRVFLDMKVAGGQTMIVEEPIAAAIKVWRPNT